MRSVLMAALAAAPVVASAAEPPRLEEIVVTASLREVPLAELPVSATVLDQRTVADGGVQHLEELLPQVPSLSWAGASSRPRYFQLRGIGELEQYQGAPNPSVGFLVDEIDFSGLGMVATLFDVEQVEVLRGPQGTRYGANALAGLIKVATRAPRPERELGVEASFAEDGLWGAGVVAGGALPAAAGDGAAWRVALQQATSDGFRENAYLGRDDTNQRDELTARARLRLLPAAGWQLDLTLLHADLDNGYDAFAIDNSFRTLSDRPGRDAQRSTGASADARFEPGAGPAFRSITAWSDTTLEASFDGDWGNDRDWGDAGPYDFFSRTLRTRTTLSQDLRLEGAAGTLGWIAGAFASRLEEDNAQDDDGNYLGETFVRSLDSRYRATNVALYGEADWSLSALTTLTAGLRLEQREARYSDTDGAAFDPRDRMWGGQLSLSRVLGENVQGWLSVSRGFKAGGFNIGAVIPGDRLQFDPEYAVSFEAGVKGRWDSLGLAGDLSVFHLRREDQQVATSFQLDPQDPLTFVYYTDNAARGRATGLEGSLQWQAHPRLLVAATLSLMESEYLGYQYGDRDLDGREWAHAPSWRYSLAATWRHPAGWMARADVGGQDRFYYDTSHDERSGAYTLVNLRAGYEAANWSVHAWLRNAFDERYAVRGFYFGNEPPDFPAKLYLRLGDPRQAGVTASFRF
ncbi:MAG: TonB-dependent receptor [Steroidobacteraceae bacterium]|jgi:outer membrane receptor protein involved in Fe transport|nr:TonB-dependent receptor [Steroidobacteraceae bacterium]